MTRRITSRSLGSCPEQDRRPARRPAMRSSVLHPADAHACGGELAPVITYEVQGRRTEHDPGGRVRNVVRLESAASRTAAFDIAEAMAAERLTVWVFKAERQSG